MGCSSPPRLTVEANRKSDHDQRKVKSETVTTELRLMGSTTERKLRHAPAPSIFGADMSSPGIPDRNAGKSDAPHGTARVESARIRPSTESRIPQVQKTMERPRPRSIPGICC